jgi:hypothetical protein
VIAVATKEGQRRQRFTITQMLEAVHASKGLVTITAETLKCDPQTVRNYAKRYSKVQHAIEEEREVLLDIAELALCRKVEQGEAWAVMFLLKTLGRHRGFIERDEQVATGDITVRVEYVDEQNGSGS